MLVKIWFTSFFVLLFAGIEYIGVQRNSMEVTAVLQPTGEEDGRRWCIIEISNNKNGTVEERHKIPCSEKSWFGEYQTGVMWHGKGRITRHTYKSYLWNN